MLRARRSRRGDVSPEEWAWLTAAPGSDPWIGWVKHARNAAVPRARRAYDRLVGLWAVHEAEIRAMWRKKPPEELPAGHPAWHEANLAGSLEEESKPAF